MLSLFAVVLSSLTHPALAQHSHGDHAPAHGDHQADLEPSDEVVVVPLEEETMSSVNRAGALIIASDRGFLGNEEIRDVVAEFVAASDAHAELVLVTGEQTQGRLDDAIGAFHESGIQEIVVLPLFLSDHNPRLTAAREMLSDYEGIEWAAPFGESYLAVDMLAERLRSMEKLNRHHTILTGYGAETPEDRAAMEADLDRLLEQASAGIDIRTAQSQVWYVFGVEGEKEKRGEVTKDMVGVMLRPGRTAIVPFNLSMKLDSMMSMNGFMQQFLPDRIQFTESELLPHPAVAIWMERELNRATMTMDDLGVVFLAHGADYDWNQTMRDAADSLSESYRMEFAFSMADPPVVERAIHKLDERGAKAIVVVRVFGMSSSFLPTVHRMLGMDIEAQGDGHSAHGHGGGHGGGHHMMGGNGPRIWTPTILTTAGGIDDHELFAKAILTRALSLSEDPSKETIVVTAHGAGSDARNDSWKETLDSLTDQMKAHGGDQFKAIHSGTWREDWPDKRDPEIAEIRGFVEAGSQDGGRVIVVPARTTLVGPEAELLEGLDFVLGSGFAPSAEFTQWVESQILSGAIQLGIHESEEAAEPASGHDHHHGH